MSIKELIAWLLVGVLAVVVIIIASTIARGRTNDVDKILIEIEWKHHKRLVCLPHDITKDQIQDIGSGFAHISYAQGNRLHILRFGQVRIYITEEWNKEDHMEGFDVIGIDITSFDTNLCKYKTRFYIHYPRFLVTAEIMGIEFDILIGFYRWEYKR